MNIVGHTGDGILRWPLKGQRETLMDRAETQGKKGGGALGWVCYAGAIFHKLQICLGQIRPEVP